MLEDDKKPESLVNEKPETEYVEGEEAQNRFLAGVKKILQAKPVSISERIEESGKNSPPQQK